MKKINIVVLLKTAFILAFCLFVFACSQNGLRDSKEFADVTISIGGFHGETPNPRSIGENGLPVLTDKDTKVTITVTYNGISKTENKNTLTVEKVPIGTEIDVKVEVKTDYASWADGKKYTVKAGQNKIDIKLAKTAKSASNFLMSVSPNTQKTSIKLGETEIFNKEVKGMPLPLTARDSLGRLYLIYSEEQHKIVLTRFTVEGKEDTAFAAAVTKLLPAEIRADISLFAVDFKNENIFFYSYAKKHLYCLEKNGNGFTLLKGTQPGDSHNNIIAMTAFDGKLFCIERNGSNPSAPAKLKVYQYKTTSGTNTLTFTALPGEKELTIVIKNSARRLDNSALFADAEGVYCLLASESGDSELLYFVGKLLHYEYKDSTLQLKKEVGLNPNNFTHNALLYDAAYFSVPMFFIGFDTENIYITDIGMVLEEKNENYYIAEDKNRIAAYNRKEGTLSFEDTDAAWWGVSPYGDIDTPFLLWEKHKNSGHDYGMRYWASATGQDSCPPIDSGNSNDALVAYSENTNDKPTDIFCYDQDGNLYIVRDQGTDKAIKRYKFDREKKTWNNSSEKKNLSFNMNFIAADISYGENYVYVLTGLTLERYKWDGEDFAGAYKDTDFTIIIPPLSSPYTRNSTAIAVNKDGIFVAVTEKQNDSMGLPTKYSLKVLKYDKNSKEFKGECLVGTTKNIETPDPTPGSTDKIEHSEQIEALQIKDGVLYAITAEICTKKDTSGNPNRITMNGYLYKIENIADTIASNAGLVEKKEADENTHTSYAYYRFNAIKPKKLVIASNAGWKDSSEYLSNKVVIYDLTAPSSGNDSTNAGGKFTKSFSSFSWY